MLVHVILPFEELAAVFTFEGALVGMGTHVLHQLTGPAAAFAAHLTYMFLTRLGLRVHAGSCQMARDVYIN